MISDDERKAKARAYGAAYRAANREKAKAASAAWRLANPDRVKALTAEYSQRPEVKANRREAARKPERVAARKASQQARKSSIAAARAAWYQANKSVVAERKKQWFAVHPEKLRIKHHNKRARRKAAVGRLSKDLPGRLLKLQRGRCACCGQSLKDGYQMDHVVPLALGGTNTDDNMQLLTPKCNNRKSAKDPVKYMQEKGFLL